MEQDRLQELIAGYALNILEEEEYSEVQLLLETDPQARSLLAEFEDVTAGLALTASPAELPVGSLNRLRQKAGVAERPAAQPQAQSPTLNPPPVEPEKPRVVDISSRRGNGFFRRPVLAYAAALVLFVTTAIFGALWFSTNNNLNNVESKQRELQALLASPNLKITDIKASNPSVEGSMRLYTDPTTDKAYLVAQNLAPLPGEKEYEVWLIAANNQPRKAGLLGSGGGGSDPAVYALDTGGEVDQYKVVAVTVEQKGGVDKPSQAPVMAGNISA